MTKDNQLSLEEVLDMLLDEFETPSRQAIAHFSKLYPDYRQGLMEFAAVWAEEIRLPEAPPLSKEQEERVATRAQSFLQNALFNSAKKSADPARQVATASLAQLAESSGQTPHDVARLAGLDTILMSKLNGRRIRVDSVPSRVAARLAEILRVRTDQVLASLTPYEGHRPGFAFLATSRPVPAPPEDFTTAVLSSTLTDEEKNQLLLVE